MRDEDPNPPSLPIGRFYSTDTMTYEEALRECEWLDEAERFIEHLPVETKPGEWEVSSRLRADWRSRSTSDRLDRPVKQGERFVAPRDIEVAVMTHWRAPFTGGNRATLPAGTIVVASGDQNPNTPGFNCVPEAYLRSTSVWNRCSCRVRIGKPTSTAATPSRSCSTTSEPRSSR